MINIPKPIFILPVFYFFIVIYTVLGTNIFSFATEVPFQLYDNITNESYIDSIVSILIAAISFMVGATMASFGKYKTQVSFLTVINQKIIYIKSIYIIVIYLTVVIFLHLGYGLSSVYYKEGYTIGDSGIAVFRILYTLLLPFSMLLLPLIKSSILRWILLILIILLVLGTSSRMIILIPFFYYLGVVIKSKKISLFKFFISVVAIIFLLNAVINFRDNQFQGLIPNLINLISGKVNYDLLNYALNYLFSFSVYASAYTIQDFSFDFKSFLYSINPLPSSYIDVSYMLNTQKFNEYSPFPAISYLALGGFKYLFLYYCLSGFTWAYILKKFQAKNVYVYFFMIILLLVFTFLSTQYNLRGVSRLTYYVVFIFLIYKITIILPKKKSFKQNQIKGNL